MRKTLRGPFSIFNIGERCVVLGHDGYTSLNFVAHGISSPATFGFSDKMKGGTLKIDYRKDGMIVYEMLNGGDDEKNYTMCAIVPTEDGYIIITLANEVQHISDKIPTPVHMRKGDTDIYTCITDLSAHSNSLHRFALWPAMMAFDDLYGAFNVWVDDEKDFGMPALISDGVRVDIYVSIDGKLYLNDDGKNKVGKRPLIQGDEQKQLRNACKSKLSVFLGNAINKFGKSRKK